MEKPSLGWQSWSNPVPKWHGLPRWDYSPFKNRFVESVINKKAGTIGKVRYWCSWYAYGWDINTQKITETVRVITRHRLPLTHILIDDGWTTWGDWHTPNKQRFPSLPSLIKDIKSHDLKVGLWFAPFLASKRSDLFKLHPDWFVKYQGHYIQGLKTFPVWEWFLPQQYLLNFEIPEVKKYITDFIDLAIAKWRVNLLKLDFLYAPYFNPYYKSDQIPHDQVSWILSYIKGKYPQVTTIACGAPFAPALGTADIIRISRDTALPPEFPAFLNKFIYRGRVKLLYQKYLAFDSLRGYVPDPDIRLFSIDNYTTNQIWDTIHTNVIGVGDNLLKLSSTKIKELQLWLANHNSQS